MNEMCITIEKVNTSKDGSNAVVLSEDYKPVQDVRNESTNERSISIEKGNTSKDKSNSVVSSQDYKIGEGSKICEGSISLGSEKPNDNIYNFPSSEEISDCDFSVQNQQNVRKSFIQYRKSAKTAKLLPAKVTGYIL